MNPANPTLSSATPRLMHDVAPPHSGYAPVDIVKTEFVQGVPVKSPGTASNPIGSQNTSGTSAAGADKAFEQILKDVNQDIKNPAAPKAQQKVKKGKVGREMAAFVPILVALLVAGSLAAAAVYAFTLSQKDTSQAAPAAAKAEVINSQTAITPEVLEDFYQTTQSGVSTLNDEQDFNTDELSEQTLGL